MPAVLQKPEPAGPGLASSPAMHPLTPLLPSEITAAAAVLRSSLKLSADAAPRFKAITLHEPAKAALLAWDDGRGSGPRPAREAYIVYLVRSTPLLYEAVVDLATQKLVSNVRVKEAYHCPADSYEMISAEKAALADERVQAELAKLQLPEGSRVVADPWIYGSDERTEPGFEDVRRQFQCYLYLADVHDTKSPEFNHYAFPLTVSPVVDVQTMKVTRIDHLPAGADFTATPPKPYTAPPVNEFTPEHQRLRTDLKPLHVVQPEGASFRVVEEEKDSGGAAIEWQKWRFRVGFNWREGPVLYNVTYDNRSVFHRVSLSDMNIPYADPRPPYHRKAAFDLGDAGAGTMANDLQLGCDCLGSIYYLSSNICNDNGEPEARRNCICIHEQDAGIGFKHTNYRTGRAVIARNRELIIQTIITVTNYDYVLIYSFNQAGEFAYEARATGILSTTPIAPGVDVPWGTIVHPGVLAAYHQHFFSLRVDPAIDGPSNRVVYQEASAMPLGPENPYGTGYTAHETEITRPGGFDLEPSANRVFKLQSTTARNPISGAPTAYKIQVPPFQKMLAHPTSLHARRAEFTDNTIYVTRHRDDELYAAGRWTNQSRGGDGVRSWAARDEELAGDPVVWVQFGINHIPRVEDFPVMPCESIRVAFKPVGFFDRNPALDVPPSTQIFNKSTLLTAEHMQPSVEGVVGENGEIVAVSNGNGAACCGNGNGNGVNGSHTNGNSNGHA